jgi:predicted ABC-type ATPase
LLAGTNGAGKSTIGGEALIQAGMEFFNPDNVARALKELDPSLTSDQANSLAWKEGKRLLERAIAERLDYAFETTLGGTTIVSLLEKAASRGFDVTVWYVALASPELHIGRVKTRVARGGHDILEANIRERYVQSVLNLIRLMPYLADLLVYDNSEEADPYKGKEPRPLPMLHLRHGKIVRSFDPARVPDWAKPIVMAAWKMQASR